MKEKEEEVEREILSYSNHRPLRRNKDVHGDDVGASHFCDSDFRLVSSIEINVVGSDTSSDGKLELFRFSNEVTRQIPRMEWCGD